MPTRSQTTKNFQNYLGCALWTGLLATIVITAPRLNRHTQHLEQRVNSSKIAKKATGDVLSPPINAPLQSGPISHQCTSNPSVYNQGSEPIVQEKRWTYQVGDTSLTIRVTETNNGQASPITFINLHQNEKTSVESLEELFPTYGGRLIDIQHKGTRRFSFEIDGELYDIDPNRIFTHQGRTSALRYLGSNPNNTRDTKALGEVEGLSSYLTRMLLEGEPKTIVALHNNTEGQYSISSYETGGSCASDAKQVHRNPHQDPDDFFFVTSLFHYQQLARLGNNVVLQDNKNVTNDGSLSVWCGQYGKPYINAEAQHGHGPQQKKMMESLYTILEN
jgi:hypothetical protein